MKEFEMNKTIARVFVAAACLVAINGIVSAQTGSQNINVTVRPATTVEERVANEIKEKELRKAAEEKLVAVESAKIAATSPRTLLSRARTLYISSDTKFFEEVQLQNALRKHAEMDSLQLAIIDGWAKRDFADIFIEIDRPLFTYTFTYEMLDHATGIILATGKVTAFDSNEAAPMLADKIIEEIRNARGVAKIKK
jgi:hypothetical protein